MRRGALLAAGFGYVLGLRPPRLNWSGCDKAGEDLQGQDLSISRLMGTSFRDADLEGADFSGSNLMQADLSGADLRGVILIGASTTGAKLARANLRGTNLRGVSLQKADLTGQIMSQGAHINPPAAIIQKG